MPLKSTPQLEERIKNEDALQWKLRSTYNKQWRPFCIGVMPEEPTEDSQAWTKLTEKDVDGIVWDDETQCEPYYAAWPVQAYIDKFRLSNNIALTYTLKEGQTEEQWFNSEREQEDDDSTYSILERKVILKIGGGTVKAYDREISPTRRIIVLEEEWEKEDD